MPHPQNQIPEPPEEFKDLLTPRNGTPLLLQQLESRYPASQILDGELAVQVRIGERATLAFRKWEICGFFLMQGGRVQDAIALFTRLYELVVVEQTKDHNSIARGSSLAWLCECYQRIQNLSLAQRYLMLTLVDEAIGCRGVYPDGGGYWRARWVFGMSDKDLEDTCAKMSSIYQDDVDAGRFPEWVLQQLGDDWKTILPSTAESAQYVVSRPYMHWLFERLEGDKSGMPLEWLARYLMSSIPGCRARKEKSHSTDYDVVCALDAPADDFRRDLGRYFLCECKYWEKPADFTTIAKFARVLESSKCRFGILFSRNGVTGDQVEPKAARRELLKLYHDTGIVVVVVDHEDLRQVVDGASLVVMLRRKYETVRLDLA